MLDGGHAVSAYYRMSRVPPSIRRIGCRCHEHPRGFAQFMAICSVICSTRCRDHQQIPCALRDPDDADRAAMWGRRRSTSRARRDRNARHTLSGRLRLPVPERRAAPTRMSSSTRVSPEDDDRAMTTRRRRRVSDCFERCDSRTVCIATIGCLTRLSVLHVQELARVSGGMAFGGRAVRVQRGAATSRVTDCGSALRRLAWPARSLPGEWWPPPRFARFASHAPVVCFAGGLMPNALHAPRPRSGRGCSRGCGSRARPVTTGASVVAERPDRDRFAIGVSANTLDMRQVHRDKLLPVRVVKQIR